VEEQPQGPEQTMGMEQQPQEMQPEQIIEPQPQVVELHEDQSSLAGNETLPQQASSELVLPYIYCIGSVYVTFPSLGVEKEFAQATGRLDATAGLTDQEATRAVLSEDANRYLARSLCYVLRVGGTDAYILRIADPLDLNQLVQTVRPIPTEGDVDAVVGLRGPIASPEECNGLELPTVLVSRIFSFTVDELVQGIPRPEAMTDRQEGPFRTAAREVFNRVRQAGDNLGNTDEDRAKNFAIMRYQGLYAVAAQQFQNNYALQNIEARRSPRSGARSLMLVIFEFTERQTNVEDRYFMEVDVTEENPFLVSSMQPFLGGTLY
jgi:hypothetical protein